MSYRLQQGFFLLLHLLLLYWMAYILRESGGLSVGMVLLHFGGIALAGSLLIWGCSRWARYHS